MEFYLIDNRQDFRSLLASFNQLLQVLELVVTDANAFRIALFMELDNLVPSFTNTTADQTRSVYKVQIDVLQVELLERLCD